MRKSTHRIPTAREIMIERVHTIPADSELEAAVKLLLDRGYSGAPVVDAEGALVGVVSEHDCIRVLAQAVADGWPEGRVADHMTTEIDAVSPDDDILALATVFADNRHRRLLVVEDSRLRGIISRRDLLRALSSVEQRGRRQRRSTVEVLDQRHRALD